MRIAQRFIGSDASLAGAQRNHKKKELEDENKETYTRVSKKEVEQLAKTLKLNPHRLLKSLDKDGDGSVSVAEFKNPSQSQIEVLEQREPEKPENRIDIYG